MRGGLASSWLLVLVLVTSSRGEGQGDEKRWSRQASAERRQGDWVPLSCANCRPVDQAPHASDGLPSVLTPPPRSEEARLLPPPVPSEGLLKQAASGFIQAYNQQQRKPHQQFLTETTSQSINRPQAQFLNSPQKPFVPEPSLEFQPPQQFVDQQSNRHPQQLQFNQQQIPESNPYLNQPFLLGPQFLSAPFFPPPSFPQNIQPINPTQIQPLAPISPLSLPVNNENFKISPDRPVFVQQITSGSQIPPNVPQAEIPQTQPPQHDVSQINHIPQIESQAQLSQLEYLVNQTNSLKNEQENEEVQLLYVPVETLNQRPKSLGRQKTLPANKGVASQQAAGTNIFSAKDHEYSTRKPHIEDQDSFNTQTHLSKHQFNSQKNLQFQQQQPPVDQEKFNSQTHTVRQQYVNHDGQFQQPAFESPQNFKPDVQATKEQYNFKQTIQQQLEPENLNSQLQIVQNGHFQQQSPLENSNNFQLNDQSINQQNSDQYLPNIQQNQANDQGLNIDQQLTTQHSINKFQQQLPPLQQSHTHVPRQQEFSSSLNNQFSQLQIHQPVVPTIKEQPYVNQPIKFNQQLSTQLTQDQHLLTQQHYTTPETRHQTASVTQTTAPDVYTTHQSKRQRFRNPQHVVQVHDSTRNVHQSQVSQTLEKFPQDYQQATIIDNSNLPIEPTTTEITTQINNVRQSWQNNQYSNNQQVNDQVNTAQYDGQGLNRYQSDHQISSFQPPKTSTLPPAQASPPPNQPPLSVYMETNGDSMVNDVLRLLKNAKTIQVLDTVGPDSPQVFVGPSNLKAPTGYIKFELPYLNTLENNRVERKVDKLPFFVAPLNFNPPPGYSKIPFPAPHIGSVVVSNVTVLQTALHEKSYVREPEMVSSSERYLDQYTLPAEISPISPQLPSLINSLQDEIYSVSSSTAAPTSLPETTTLQATQFRGRGTSRGTIRGSSDYQTSPAPTRRTQSRTRRPWDGRPYSRRQPVSDPTTTTSEPSTEAPIQQFTPQPEQSTFNGEPYTFQNPASPVQVQLGNSQPNIEQHTNTYFDDHSVQDKYNQGQFTLNHQQIEQPAHLVNTQNTHHVTGNDNQNIQYYENQQLAQENSVPTQETAYTTTLPSVTSPSLQQEEYTFKTQRTGGSRREPNRSHQRFRSRQRLTTSTTTEKYEEPEQPIVNEQVDNEAAYQNVPRNRPRSHNQQRLVENTHFQANVPVNQFKVQTERADIAVQTTERFISAHNDEHIEQQNFNQDQYNSPVSKGHPGNQPPTSHRLQLNNYQEQNYQSQQPQAQPSDPNISQNHKDFVNLQFSQHNQAQLSAKQLPETIVQEQINPKAQPSQQNFQNNYRESIGHTLPQVQQNYFDQSAQFEQVPTQTQTNFNNLNLGGEGSIGQVHNQVQQNYYAALTNNPQQDNKAPQEQSHIQTNTQQYDNNHSQFQNPQENIRESSNINLRHQGQHVTTSNLFETRSDVTTATPQGTTVQTQELINPYTQSGNDHEIAHNQLRVVKYNKLHSRTPSVTNAPFNSEHSRRGHYQHQSSENISDPSATEATTKAALVRVKGRVRGRQRTATRNAHTTTEPPNYPTTYLSRQRSSQEKDESQEYIPRKRPNYSSRQSYNQLKTNKEVPSDVSTTEKNYGISERHPSSERYLSNIEVTTTSTTTTETPTTKITRRYQHILNRNKVRRVRPTDSPSTSGSSGTLKFLMPTTPPPVTRLPSTRGRIRKPVSVKTTTSTTEYPLGNSKWNEKDNFAPSAGSNEILEPLYQTQDKPQQSFGFQHTPIIQTTHHKTTPKPIIAPSTDEDNYWNPGVTIQQSTSFDFKPDSAAVTPPSFQGESGQFQGTFSPIWNGQIELQDGNYYDVFRQQQIAKQINDQIPFSSDQQKVVYQGQETKNKQALGKENQYTEKSHEVRPVETDEDIPSDERIYPVYREIKNPAETIQDETTHIFTNSHEGEEKDFHKKDIDTNKNSDKTSANEETIVTGSEVESKEVSLKQKNFAPKSGKKGVRRRGSWVRVRVRKPQDMFETAESQNLATLSENAIPAATKIPSSLVDWSQEPSTETSPTTSPSPSEPAETINFEEALKDMLKEFITNNDEEEEVNTEGIGDVLTDTNNNTTITGVNIHEDEEETTQEEDKHPVDDATQTEIAEKLITEHEDQSIKTDENPVKTEIPELSSEVLTDQSTIFFQTEDNAESTTEPEFTTLINEQEYKSSESRILGTSTTTEISLETEICYRGRCVKTKKLDSDSDLLPME